MNEVFIIVKYEIHSSGEDTDFKIIGVYTKRCYAETVCDDLESSKTDRDVSYVIEVYPLIG